LEETAAGSSSGALLLAEALPAPSTRGRLLASVGWSAAASVENAARASCMHRICTVAPRHTAMRKLRIGTVGISGGRWWQVQRAVLGAAGQEAGQEEEEEDEEDEEDALAQTLEPLVRGLLRTGRLAAVRWVTLRARWVTLGDAKSSLGDAE
jgi:hypothetical protein